MYEDLIKKTEAAIDDSMHWAETGWTVTFGPRQTEINSLQAAEELPETFVYRSEAINYWKQARLTGYDAGVSGLKALESLKKGDLKDEEDHLRFCLHKPPYLPCGNAAAKHQILFVLICGGY